VDRLWAYGFNVSTVYSIWTPKNANWIDGSSTAKLTFTEYAKSSLSITAEETVSLNALCTSVLAPEDVADADTMV